MSFSLLLAAAAQRSDDSLSDDSLSDDSLSDINLHFDM